MECCTVSYLYCT